MKAIMLVCCLTYLMLMQTLVTNGIAEQPCSFEHLCDCYNDILTKYTKDANCSDRHLLRIPVLSTTILSLDISFNEIKDIPEKTFEYSRLMVELDISYNNISCLHNGSFLGLNSLRVLNLTGNKLVYKENVFGIHCFTPLLNLRILNIENNIGFYTAGQVYPKLSDLILLEDLTMDGVQDNTFNMKSENLTQLLSLKISNFSGICAIKELDINFFQSLPHLTRIEISGCQIRKILQGTLKYLTHLTYLDLSYNMQLEFKGVIDMISDLQFTSIKILKLNKICTTFHMNVKVPYNFTKYLRNTSLVELHADSNRIQLLDIGVLANLPKTLSYISAADNSFSYGHYLYEALQMNISVLNVSNLFATHDIPSGHVNKRHAIEDDRETGALEHIASYVNNYYKLKHTSNKESIFVRIENGYKINVHVPVPKYLKKLFINRSLLRFSIPRCTVLQNSLEHLDISENLATRWIGPILNIQKLKYLNFSHNFCSNVSGFFFQDAKNLEHLLINNNLLGFIIPFDIEGEILSALKKLKVLDLSQNRIEFVPKSFFKSQIALQQLDLSSNLLEGISFEITQMKNLSIINLSDNHIASLGNKALGDLDKINSGHNLTIDLNNNPLQCDCETVDFVKWIATTSVTLRNQGKYQCLLRGKTKTFLKEPKSVYQNLVKECSSYGYVVTSISFGLVMFVTLTVVGLVYRYRWKLRYLYYMTKQKYRDYDLLQDDTNDYLYDAFISYADEDQDFVHGELIANLEDSGSFKLCLHKRDFLPGRDIAGNVTNAIHNSRKTVVIMTRHYLESYWCMFEFNMARMESIYSRDGKRVLFLVLYEQIDTQDLPLLMLELVQSESFIEYPHDDYGNGVFWMKMKEALQ